MLFNPWSIGTALVDKKLGPHWVASGQSHALRLAEFTTPGQVMTGPSYQGLVMRTIFVRTSLPSLKGGL